MGAEAMTRISEGERIVKLVLFVRESGPVTLAAIRRRFPFEYGDQAGGEQSMRRRFERDKKTLAEYGLFLKVDDRQRYSLDLERSCAAPLSLTGAQVSLLRLLCAALLEDEAYPFKEDLRMVLVKLGDELEIPDMLPQVGGANDRARPSEPQGLAKVRKAISARKRLSFEYSNAGGMKSLREVEPFGCFFLRGLCYVVAFDLGNDDVRCFRLDRMSKLKVNAASPGTPDFDERPFDASDHYGLPFQFGEESWTARVRFDHRMAARARQLSMGLGSFEERADGVIWTIECKDLRELARWCIENGPGIRILEPLAGVRACEEGLSRFLDVLDASSERAAHEG